jgi:hypothetical protein
MNDSDSHINILILIKVLLLSTFLIENLTQAYENHLEINSVQTEKTELKMQKNDELQHRGKDLRHAIDETYRKLNESNTLKTMGNGRNEITDVITKYIPIGENFDDAEVILKAAGFNVGPRERHPVFPGQFCAIGVIEQYAPTPLGKTSITIYLQPINKDDWTVVYSITAEITKQII